MLSVTPLDLGTLTVDRSTLTFMRGFGEPVDVPIVAWLLRDERRTWLVDTGAPPVQFTVDHIAPMRQTPEQTLLARLREHGVTPSDVDTVVLTHLHFDHVGGYAELPAARFHVQRAELEYARSPLPIHRRGYQHPDAGFGPPGWLELDWAIADGDLRLADDVRLLLTPGHTPGLQSVLVDTAHGPVAIASDNVPLFANWRGSPPAEPHIPSGVHVDLRACYASFDRLEQTRATVVPGHDPALFTEPARATADGGDWQVCRVATETGARVAVVGPGGTALVEGVASMGDLLSRSRADIEVLVEAAIASCRVAEDTPAPLAIADEQEVWAAGVTYERSRAARVEESGRADVYDLVYDAPRPELFLKAPPGRVNTPGAPARLRRDSTWDACEPELVAVFNSSGETVGYTIGDDVSSRSIEAENPLYLPQAKIFDGACVLAAGWTPAWRWACADTASIELRILREGKLLWSGETSTALLRRRPDELASWLFRELSFPHGAFLLTGTGIVAPDDLQYRSGDVVEIEIEGLGVLVHGLTA